MYFKFTQISMYFIFCQFTQKKLIFLKKRHNKKTFIQSCNLSCSLHISLRLENELHMFNAISLEENHDNKCPQSQNKAPRRMPIFRLWFLQKQGGDGKFNNG